MAVWKFLKECFHVYWWYSGQTCKLQMPNLSQSQMAPQLRHCWEVCDMTFSEFPQPFNLNGYKKVWRKKNQIQIYIYSWNWNSPPKTGTSWLWGSWEMGSSRRISLRMAKWILMVLPNSFASWWVRVPQGGRTVSEKEKVKVLKVSKWRDSNSFVTLGYCVNIIYIYII